MRTSEREVTQMFLELKKQYKELDGYAIGFGNGINQLGLCKYKAKVIRISKNHIQYSEKEAVFDTLLHEVAHAIAGSKAGHGKKWKEVCIKIGAKPERLASESVYVYGKPKPKYKAVCPKCGEVHFKNRNTKSKSSCGICSPRFDESRLLIYKENK